VRDFLCPHCGQRLAFENSRCLSCGNDLGFDLTTREFIILLAASAVGSAVTADDSEGDRSGAVDAPAAAVARCSNAQVAICNWVVPVDAASDLCASCALTRTRPSDADAVGLIEFAEAEAAKRRLVLELTELGLPIVGRDRDPNGGLCFDLLSSNDAPVITGHDQGVITVDLAESDDVHREQLRISMDEPYRTLLGHFRHEIGHYYFTVLVRSASDQTQFTELFGDPDQDYQQALDRHYSHGAPEGWQNRFVSSYATMHPAEDWAETFAHYLHIRDTIDTAAAFGLAPSGATLERPLTGNVGFDRIIELWLPLSWALNMINRSMGHSDLYPFVLPPAALDKMRIVHNLVNSSAGS
jgi:hypothetical protein